MGTLDKLRIDAENAMNRVKEGSANKRDLEIIQIYLSIFSKKCGRAGKRKPIKTGK